MIGVKIRTVDPLGCFGRKGMPMSTGVGVMGNTGPPSALQSRNENSSMSIEWSSDPDCRCCPGPSSRSMQGGRASAAGVCVVGELPPERGGHAVVAAGTLLPPREASR